MAGRRWLNILAGVGFLAAIVLVFLRVLLKVEVDKWIILSIFGMSAMILDPKVVTGGIVAIIRAWKGEKDD